MKKEPKKVWIIRDSPEGFYMVDHEGEMRWSPTERQSRHAMAIFAFEAGADEVLHDYDLVKYDT